LPWSDEPLCPLADKARLEADNGVRQLDYLVDLVDQGPALITEAHLLGLHRLAVEGIYGCAGSYRTARHELEIRNSEHQPPPAGDVKAHVLNMLDRLNDKSVHSLRRASYALWRTCWIHPFPGGNGRTSRALAYLVMCLGSNTMLPGVPSLPSLINDHRKDYLRVLRLADAAEREGKEDLAFCTLFVTRLVMLQVLAALRAAKVGGRWYRAKIYHAIRGLTRMVRELQRDVQGKPVRRKRRELLRAL
jgi:Fic family protein